ncbi:hypothetical protein G195_002045 [Phytophthora kernoviae 00238/432]|uniref:CBM20 domain-containing protein n=1 Tax=Phytophthora kernoviae 00238/432 TaxID=1284355 RepID=A0A8J4SBG4_9STRA|nr:hypothetical protein G195_002045 [Phytophthora kernoviae 00238/432]
MAGSALPLFPVASVLADADTAVTNKQNFSTDVIYQVFTDRFLDGNPSNNPTGAAYDASCSNLKLYCGGDWQGLINKINDNYFSDLGITALWISQPVENIYSLINYSGVNNTAYHGYWARDFKKTNPAFGTMTDFQNLINTAHAKGIKVIIDFAPNHTSPAMETDTSFAENGKLYNNGTLLGGYTNDTNKYFHHNGGSDFSTLENGIYKNLYDLADLNHNNSTIDTYFKDAIKLWLDMGIDGIRVDAVKHMPMGWQKNWMSSIYGYKPVFTFGEWFLGSSASDADNTNFANQSGMSLLDFRFNNEVRNVFRDNTSSMVALDSMITSTAADYAQVNDQVSVRFVINNASTTLGQNLYLSGSVAELGNWSTGPLAIGPAFNQVIYSYPTWYYDVSVPAGTKLEFKFFKKNGSTITWENGNNHTFTTPTSGTATVTVDWQ